MSTLKRETEWSRSLPAKSSQSTSPFLYGQLMSTVASDLQSRQFYSLSFRKKLILSFLLQYNSTTKRTCPKIFRAFPTHLDRAWCSISPETNLMEETMQRQILKRFILWCATVAVLCATAMAQTVTGNISGTVADQTGAVIPGAKVTATNIATSVPTSVVTNNSGIYNLRFLQVGQYEVTVEAKGFTKLETQPFVLEAVQDAKVDASLKPGSESAVMQVRAESTILNTENGMVKTTISETLVNDMPINGHNFTELTQLMPGSTVADGNQ